VAVAVGAVVAAGACTGSAGGPSSSSGTGASSNGEDCLAFVEQRNGGDCIPSFELDGHRYVVVCTPVPETMLDVTLPATWGNTDVRAIVAVPSVQGVAVAANDEAKDGTDGATDSATDSEGCGRHALALRADLDERIGMEIVAELEAAASLPPDLEK